MKKIVVLPLFFIIIATLIFASSPPNATLRITTGKTNIVTHGFFENPLHGDHTMSSVLVFFGLSDEGEYTVRNLTSSTVFDEFSEAVYEGVAYYYFAANTANTHYSVTFSITPFFSSSSSYEVPLQLRVGEHASSDSLTVNAGTSDKVGTHGSLEEASGPITYTAITTTPALFKEVKFAALKLDVLLDQSEIGTKGIAAGDDYVATVTAIISVN